MKLLPDWMEKLTLQQQAVLMLALRGPDGFAKHHPCKPLLRFYRALLIKDASLGRMLEDGEYNSMMDMRPMTEARWEHMLREFAEVEDSLPLHFYTHLMHAAQILAYKHPRVSVRYMWGEFYAQCCAYLHLPQESEVEMDKRLNDFGRMLEALDC